MHAAWACGRACKRCRDHRINAALRHADSIVVQALTVANCMVLQLVSARDQHWPSHCLPIEPHGDDDDDVDDDFDDGHSRLPCGLGAAFHHVLPTSTWTKAGARTAHERTPLRCCKKRATQPQHRQQQQSEGRWRPGRSPCRRPHGKLMTRGAVIRTQGLSSLEAQGPSKRKIIQGLSGLKTQELSETEGRKGFQDRPADCIAVHAW